MEGCLFSTWRSQPTSRRVNRLAATVTGAVGSTRFSRARSDGTVDRRNDLQVGPVSLHFLQLRLRMFFFKLRRGDFRLCLNDLLTNRGGL